MKKMIIIILISFFHSSCNQFSGYKTSEKKLFDKIYIGMSKEEVFTILGQPDDSGYNSFESRYDRYSFFSSTKSFWSTLPTVVFDSSSKVVDSYYYIGEGAQ